MQARFFFLACLAALVQANGTDAKIVLRELDPLRVRAAEADFVLVVTVNRMVGGANAFSDLTVLEEIKSHKQVKGRKQFRQPGIVPRMAADQRLITLGTVDKGGEIRVRETMTASPALVQYVRGLTAVEKDSAGLARLCLSFYDSSDDVISQDAFRTLQIISDADYARIGPDLPRERLRRLVKTERQSERLGLAAYLLGCAGDAMDSHLLDEVLLREVNSGHRVEGLLKGLLLVDAEEGWRRLLGIAVDGKQEFTQRYDCLLACRYVVEQRPKLIARDEQNRALKMLLVHPDLTDIVIENIRRWRRWELTPQVLAAAQKKDAAPIVKNALIRYCLQCPETAAARFLARARKEQFEMVAEQEERLKAEKTP